MAVPNEYDKRMAKIEELINQSSLPSKPKTYGTNYEFPENITEESIENIGAMMSKIAAYRGYAQRMSGLAEIRKNAINEWMRKEVRQILATMKDSKLTITAKKEEAMEKSEIQEISDKLSEMTNISTLYTSLVNIYNGHLEILSREISRRKNEY